jgi:hypothetical protein
VVALAAAAQDRRVAGLEAQRARVAGHVGPALVDDADHAEGHAHPLDAQAVRPLPLGDHRADRVRQLGDLLDAPRHRLDARGIEPQPVEHRATRSACLRRLHVAGVRREDLRLAGAQGRRRGGQRRVLLRRRGERERVRGLDGRAPDGRHQSCDVLHGHASTRSSRWIISSRPR